MNIRSFKKIIRRIVPFEGIINYCWHLPIEVLLTVLYGFPGKRIKVIGVAGTKGKTTTSYFISQLLEASGEKTALYSTAAIKIGDTERLNELKMTTPGGLFVRRFLRDARKQGCTYVVLEVSSHALKQFRLWGIPFVAVVITNMMPDHLDYHKTAKDYTLSHMKMFTRQTRVSIVNGDDEHSSVFAKMRRRVLTFGQKEYNTFRIRDISSSDSGMSFGVAYYGRTDQFDVPYIGDYNAYNTVAALATVYGLGISIKNLPVVASRLIPAPGRMERIASPKGFDVIVDYAHSPDSFENLFKAIRPLVKGKMIAVTGACGDRDARVRPLMGRLLAQYCDLVVITNDDPYTENPEKIMAELIEGLTTNDERPTTDVQRRTTNGQGLTTDDQRPTTNDERRTTNEKLIEGRSWFKVPDRKTAIEKGISLAGQNDTVLVLGKGAEQWQVFADKKIPWDDREVVKEIINYKNR